MNHKTIHLSESQNIKREREREREQAVGCATTQEINHKISIPLLPAAAIVTTARMCFPCNARLRRTPRVRPSTVSAWHGLLHLQVREEEGEGKEGGREGSV